jgi:hypothetical protein
VVLGKSLFTSKPSAPATPAPTTSAPAATHAPPPAAGASFALVALDVVHVGVYRKIGEVEGEELFKGWLAKGETKMIPWTSEVYLRASEGANLKIEIKGKRYDTEFRGNGRSRLPEPIY